MTKVSELVSQNVGSAITSFQTWGGIIYNVKNYGAKGDGVTDDTAAITATLAAAGANGGGEVFFPPGNYVYSSLFSPPSNVIISGLYGSSIITMKPSVLPAFGFINVGSISNVIVRDLKFVGNGIAPTTPGTAESAFFFLNCTNILIENCYFTGYMGIGVGFQGGTDTHVIKCKFENHGQDLTAYRGTSPKAVPAVWVGYSNKGLKVIDCDFVNCHWSAVFMLGTNGLVDGCRMDTIGESAIYSEYSTTSPTGYNTVTNNNIKNVYQIDVTACGIEWTTSYSVIANNVITSCDADGIAVTTCSYVTVEGNVVSDTNKSNILGGSGICVNMKAAIQPNVPTYGKGIVIVGNVCWDDSATARQLYGIRVTQTGGGAALINSTIADNQCYRNVTADFNVDPGMMEDPTNIIRNNAGWLETQKNIGTFNTTASGQNQLTYLFIPANSLGKTRGIRIKAWGSVTGTTNTKTIYLKFDTSDAEFASISYLAAENGQWVIEAEIYNNAATNVQNRRASTYKGGTVGLFNSVGAIDTTVSKAISVLGGCASVSDSVICNGLVVTRI